MPTNERKCLDLIPVDMVCRGMTLIAAALIERRHEPIYQLATSASNPCDMGRSIELTGLAHRKHYRAQQGLEHWMRMHFDTIPVSKARYEKFSVPAQKAVVQGINRAASALQLKRPPLARAGARPGPRRKADRALRAVHPAQRAGLRVRRTCSCFRRRCRRKSATHFGYERGRIDWWDYWINIHIPALRKWCYPLIEGRQLEARPRREFPLAGIATRRDAPRAHAGGDVRSDTRTNHGHLPDRLDRLHRRSYRRRFCSSGHGEPLNLLVRAKTSRKRSERLWQALQLHFDFPRFQRAPATRASAFSAAI